MTCVCQELGLKITSPDDPQAELSLSLHHLAGSGWSMVERVAGDLDDWADPVAISLSRETATDIVVVQVADSDAVCVTHLSGGQEVGRVLSPSDGRGYFPPAPQDEASFAGLLREDATVADLRGALEQRSVFIDDIAAVVLTMLGIDPSDALDAPAATTTFADDDGAVPAVTTHPRFVPHGRQYFSREADPGGRLVVDRFAGFVNEGAPTDRAWVGCQGPLFEQSLAKITHIIVTSAGEPTGLHHPTGGNSAAMVQVPPVAGPPVLSMEGDSAARRRAWRASRERLKASFSVGFVLEELQPGCANFFVTVEIPGLPDSLGYHWFEGTISSSASAIRFTVREPRG